MSPASTGSLNWREIDLVLEELALPGSLIQEIHQPRHDRLVFHLFRAGQQGMVLVSLSPRFPRIHALSEKLANPGSPLRFASFLRAHIRGGRIESAEQLRSPVDPALGERIVRITVRRGDDVRVLWIRLWGAAANAVLTDASGLILDAFYRRPKKGEISGAPFAPRGKESAQPRTKAAAAVEYTVRELPGDGSFNGKLETLYRELEGRGDRERAAAQAEAELEMSENKLLSNLEKLRGRLSEYGNLERFRELGDLLTSNLHLVGKGERWLRVEDFFHDGTIVEIELKPGLTPAQNAEGYYDRHRKARLGRGKVQEEIENLEATLVRIRAQTAALAANPDPGSLATVAKSAAKARKPLHENDVPGLVFVSPPFRIMVGRTAAENDELLRKKVRGNDWWFHSRDWPGAYVFVKAQPGKSLPLETMLDAATLAVHFSKGKTSGQGDVYYTRVKYLRRAKGARRGTVLPTQEKNLHVKLDPARIERLKSGALPETPGADVDSGSANAAGYVGGIDHPVERSSVILELFPVHFRRDEVISERYVAPRLQHLLRRAEDLVDPGGAPRDFRLGNASHELERREEPADLHDVHAAARFHWIHPGYPAFEEQGNQVRAFSVGVHEDDLHAVGLEKAGHPLVIRKHVFADHCPGRPWNPSPPKCPPRRRTCPRPSGRGPLRRR